MEPLDGDQGRSRARAAVRSGLLRLDQAAGGAPACRRCDELDLDHLVEAVEELGDLQREAVLSNARVVLEHILKLAHSPATDPRNGWRATVREHRARLELQITLQLRQALQDELERVYAIARRNAEGAARSRRASRGRHPARHLSLHPGPDHRRLVAVTAPARHTRNRLTST